MLQLARRFLANAVKASPKPAPAAPVTAAKKELEAASRAAAQAKIPDPVTIRYDVGQPMPNIAIHAGVPDPICKPIEEYPKWVVKVYEEMTEGMPRMLPATIQKRYAESVRANEEAQKNGEADHIWTPTRREMRRARRTACRINNQESRLKQGKIKRIKVRIQDFPDDE